MMIPYGLAKSENDDVKMFQVTLFRSSLNMFYLMSLHNFLGGGHLGGTDGMATTNPSVSDT